MYGHKIICPLFGIEKYCKMWIYKCLSCAGAEKISVNWSEPKNLNKCNQLWRWTHLNDGYTCTHVTCWLGYQVDQQMESAGIINNPGLYQHSHSHSQFPIPNSQFALAFRHYSIHLGDKKYNIIKLGYNWGNCWRIFLKMVYK